MTSVTLTREQVVRLAAIIDEENTGWESVTLRPTLGYAVDALLTGDGGQMRSRHFIEDDGEIEVLS